MTSSLPPLPYPYGALEPRLSRQLVAWHHTHHHAALLSALERVASQLERLASNADANAERLWEHKQRYPVYASGAFLHQLYWTTMRPNGQRQPSGDLAVRIQRDFGSYEEWAEDFLAVGMIPDNGWALLIHDPVTNRLRNIPVEGHTEGASWGAWVLLACDVWEHAYYAHYGPRRDDYIRAYIDLLDWSTIAEPYYRSSFGNSQPATAAGGEHVPVTLPFGYSSLRDISSQTIRWHYETHYLGHVHARNRLERRLLHVTGTPTPEKWPEFADLHRHLAFHAAGQTLHELSWQVLGGTGGRPGGELSGAMANAFGSVEQWYRDLRATALSPQARWVLLVWDSVRGRLHNLLLSDSHVGALWHSVPLLPIDVVEHAYYYDRGPDRLSYLNALLSNISWMEVESRLSSRL